MARLRSYGRTVLDCGFIATWVRRTPQNPFKLYFQKEVDGEVLRGMYVFPNMKGMVKGVSLMTRFWDKLSKDSYDPKSFKTLEKYRAWKRSRTKVRKRSKPKENFFEHLMKESHQVPVEYEEQELEFEEEQELEFEEEQELEFEEEQEPKSEEEDRDNNESATDILAREFRRLASEENLL